MISSASCSFTSTLPPVSRRGRCVGHRRRWFRSPGANQFVVFFPTSVPQYVSCCKSKFSSLLSSSSSIKKVHCVRGTAVSLAEEGNGEEEFQVVTAIRSNYNDIVILDTPQGRMLLLDSTNNVHSIFNRGQKWTGSYWDEFASLPAIVPQGPIAILGLGGGTAAHLMLDIWPSLDLEGWEIDEVLIDKAREYMGLLDLEKRTVADGILHVNIGDAFSPSVNVPGGYAGLVIDLFSGGRVLPQLQEVATWLELHAKLMPNGRIMVNCGAANDGTSNSVPPEVSSIDDTWVQNSTIRALCQAFPGQVNWKKLQKEEGDNCLALTGPLPDLTRWSAVLPDRLSLAVKQWRPCFPL
ncbi:uncharacterized protein LOC127813102 [Diospyros lotus]|uniref:uncharacterized protein LOC127813102 n=1 Tax=Diospyros lotus TaxID=55363 RepID=UPI0022560BCE|nr:uncharacterized protein LOC127813102 [Diospyros lotus]